MRHAPGNGALRLAALTATPLGAVVRPDAVDWHEGSPNRTLADAVRSRLREDLLSGRFEPGAKLKLRPLQALYDVGTTPLREALFNLAADGLVTVEGQKGFRVAPISLEMLKDITRLRLVLEPMAVKLSVQHGDDEWEADIVATYHRLTRLRATWTPGDHEALTAVAAAHRRFHHAIISGSHSPWLTHFVMTLFDHSERYRRLSVAYEQKRRNVDREHKAIRDACTSRQARRAVQLVRGHITRTTEIVASLAMPPERAR